MEQLILSRYLEAPAVKRRIECQLRHASAWNVYLQELKRLLRTKKRGLEKHPERHIGKEIDTEEEQREEEQDLPGVEMAKYLLDNVSELVSSVVASPSVAPETIYFLLDLLHCCDKQQQKKKKKMKKKGSGTITQSSSKKRKAQSSSATETATLTVESPLLSAIKQVLQEGRCTSLHTAVDFQLYFKLCDILTHISSVKAEEEGEEEEGREEGNGSALLEECTMVTERYITALYQQQQQQQHDGDDGKTNIFQVPSLAAPGCLLFEGREMAKVVPARLFAVLVHQANRTTGMGLRHHHDVSAASIIRPLRCMAAVLFPSPSATGTTNGTGQKQQTMLGLLQVLSASDDDLVDTLLDLTELWLRCSALPLPTSSSAPVSVGEVQIQTLFVACFGVGIHPLSNDEDHNDGNNNHSDNDGVSLPIVLFLWFAQYALCCDEGVALDLLLSPETRALEYFLRCTKLMATSSSTQIAASRQAMVAMVAAMVVSESESESSSSSSSQSVDAGGTVVVWEHQQQWSRVSPALWIADRSKPVLVGCTRLSAPLPLSEIRAFLERFWRCITGSRSTSGLRASGLLSKRLEAVVKLIRDL